PVLPAVEKEAQDLFRQAGDAYAAAAALSGLKPREQADYLWNGVKHALSAGETSQAVERLERLVSPEPGHGGLAEAWYQLGSLRESAGAREEATRAYLKCIEHNTRFDYLARHRIALSLLQAKKIDDAEKTLIQNVDALRFEADHEALTLSLAVL